MTINVPATIRVYVDGLRSTDPATDGITFVSSDTNEDYISVTSAGVVTPKARTTSNITITVNKEGSTSVELSVSVQ